MALVLLAYQLHLALVARSVHVTMLDEQPSAGGQIYRNLANVSAEQAQRLGSDYVIGKSLLKQLEQAIEEQNSDECFAGFSVVRNRGKRGFLVY